MVAYQTQIIQKYLALKKCLIKTLLNLKSFRNVMERCFAMHSLTARTVLCLFMARQAREKLTPCRVMLSKLFIDDVVQISMFPAALKQVKIFLFQIQPFLTSSTAKIIHQMAATEELPSKKSVQLKALHTNHSNKTVKIKSSIVR